MDSSDDKNTRPLKEEILSNMECSMYPGLRCNKTRSKNHISKIRKKKRFRS